LEYRCFHFPGEHSCNQIEVYVYPDSIGFETETEC